MKDQILSATGDELSRLAGEVLVGEHEFIYRQGRRCRHCNKTDVFADDGDICEVPLTWPEAMKWRDWGVNEFGVLDYIYAVNDVYSHEFNIRPHRVPICVNFGSWGYTNMQPEHYIKAACLCELGTQSSERIE